MGFVGTKPTVSSNVVIADAGTIGSASDEDAIAIAADGSVTFTQDIELGHASDTTIARASAGQITVEGTAVLLAGAQTGITTILNASTKIGRDSDNLIDFATTDNKLIFRVEGVNEVELVQNALSPVTSDGVALGTGSLMWSDIFLASAGVVNFNNGNVTITHAAGKLTTNADLEFLRDSNNADVKLTLGTSAAESLIIQVLNGGSNKTAEEIHFSTATASGTANHGKMVFDVDGTDIATIDDGGIDIGSGLTFSINGTDVVSAAGAITGITSLLATDIKIGEDDETKIDFEDANTINFYANNAKEVVLAENSISPGTSDGTALGTTSLMWSDLFLADGGVINLNNGDVLLTHSSNTLTLTGGGLVVGVDDTGHDVKFFGASAGAYMEWDESADQLRIMGASADATTSTGKLLLATSLTDINANDVIGKIEFQAPHEAGGTDAITVSAGIEAVAQGTFSSSVNSTDLVFKTGHSEAATEKFRFTSQGELGIGGANYGSDGQVLTSTGAGTAPAWEDAGGGGVEFTATANGAISAGDAVAIRSDGDIETAQGIQEGKAWTGFASNSGTTVDSNDNGYYASMGFDPDNNKFMVVYRDGDNSHYPTMVMGHISNASTHTMSFGTPVVLKSSATYQIISSTEIPYDTNVDRFLVPYTTNDGNIYAKVCTVNDAASNTITAGSEQTIEAGGDRTFAIVFDSNANRMVMVFEDESNSNITSAAAFTVRGGSDNDIQTLGSTLDVTGADDIDSVIQGLCFDSNDNKVMFVYGDASNSTRATAVALTVDPSDNSITKGTAVQLNTTTLNAGYQGAAIHHAAKNINVHITRNSAGTNLLYQPFTSSSGVITAGTLFTETGIAALGHETGGYLTADYNPDFERIVVMSAYSGLRVQVGDISGTGSSATYVIDDTIAYVPKNGDTNGGYVTAIAGAYDTGSNKHAIFYFANTSDKGLYATLPTVPYNCGNFIGIANSAISNDATGTVTSGGIGTNQSSLTVGSQYYIDSGGALTTTSGGTPVGRALSATTILVNAPVKQ